MNKIFTLRIAVIILIIITLTSNAAAYIGPGTGLSAIGSLLALLVGVIVAIVGFLWYPLKRIFGKKSQEPDQIQDNEE